MAGTHNPLLPEMATVIENVQETHNIKTFRVRFDDEEKMKHFSFGQCISDLKCSVIR